MSDTVAVKVAIRVRPFSEREMAENCRECLQYFAQHSQIAISEKIFAFDNVFDPTTPQDVVYNLCAAPLLEHLFKGYNCTILAYGQTGSGKTYTMGTEETYERMKSEERGVIPRIVDSVFDRIGSSNDFDVSVSMLEIYEEKILDLLNSSRDLLQIRELKGNVFVQGLSTHQVDNLAATMIELEKGCQLRSKGETAMNDKSSRSHAIFTIYISKKPTDDDETSFKSKLHLVDLAGSERLKKTQAEGERMREGIKINEGLLALGNVIAALSEQGTTGRHIPYRDSKITRLLQDSLGGNSYTVMIACVSPAEVNAEETLATLRYADRTKKIKNKPMVNIDPNIAAMERLKSELATVKLELLALRGENNSHTTSYGLKMPTKYEFDDLEKRYCELQNENHKLNVRFAESVAENSRFVEQLLVAEQMIEKLKGAISNAHSLIDERDKAGNYKDILNLFDLSHFNIQPDDENENSVVCEVDENDDGGNDQNYVSKFLTTQTALQHRMADILEEIKNKEKAFEATTASQAEIEKMRAAFTAEVEELQQKLIALEAERNELITKLKGSTTHHKVSEERRKRLLELEKQLDAYKKRLAEIKRLERENNNLQLKAKQLNHELMELKKLRVKMSKKLKDEEAKFRNWKVKADRELMQMKNRERKREMEMARQQQASSLQLAVYRRKYEEANACNRRLQQQLSRSSARTNTPRTDEQLLAFLDEELAIAFSAAEAKIHCKILNEQREALSIQLKNLEAQLNCLKSEPPYKRRASNDGANTDSEKELNLLEEIKNVKREIELRSTELNDIQAKCKKADSEDRVEQRWSSCHSLVEAKIALKHIFSLAIKERRSAFEKEILLEELKRKLEERSKNFNMKIENLENQLRNEKKAIETLKGARIHSAYMNIQRDDEILSQTFTKDVMNENSFDYSEQVRNSIAETEDKQMLRLQNDQHLRKRSLSHNAECDYAIYSMRDRKRISEEQSTEHSYVHWSAMRLRPRSAKANALQSSSDEDENDRRANEDINDISYYPTPNKKCKRSDRHRTSVFENPVSHRTSVSNHGGKIGENNTALSGFSGIREEKWSREKDQLASSLLGMDRRVISKSLFDNPMK